MAEIVLTDESFKKEILDSDGIKVVDFWAAWCYPCKVLSPVIDELASKYEGKVTVGKLNVDENPLTSDSYNISGIPTVIIFQNGKKIQQLVGVQPKEVYQKALDSLLSSTT